MKRADINLPINPGDDILTGHWKNHREKVKDIGTDKNGQPTINNHGILSIRIPSLMPQSKTASEHLLSKFWIDPNGTVFNVPFAQEHADYAVEQGWIPNPQQFERRYDKVQFLLNQGYCRAGISTQLGFFECPSNPSDALSAVLTNKIKECISMDIPARIQQGDNFTEITNSIELGEFLHSNSSMITASTAVPTVFLGGDVSKEDWRSNVFNHFKDSPVQFIDPYDPNWSAEESIYLELADAATADLIIFYKGGEGTQKEQDFFDTLELPYESYDDLPTLITGIETFLSDWTNKATTTLSKGDTVKIEGIPVVLEEPVEVSTAEGNIPLIDDLKSEPTEAQASIRIITAALHELGCVLIPVPQYIRSYLLTEFMAEHLDTADLAEDLLESVEVDSHITCLFGIKAGNEDADCDTVRKLFDKPVHIKTSAVQYFDNEDATVAYVAIDSPELEALHYAMADAIENEDTHPDYVPHICLAYLKPGKRLKAGIPKSFEWDASVAVVSQPDGHMVSVLDGNTDPAVAVQHIIDTMVGA